MATRRELLEQVQRISGNPADDLPGLATQMKMLAKIMLVLEKHYEKKEKTLDVLAKKIQELVSIVNSVRESPKRPSTSKTGMDTSEIVATLRLKPIKPPGIVEPEST
jgi:hypothetical protein